MNIISYSLFGDRLLYWRLIPLLIVANETFFPDFKMRFHVLSEIEQHPIYPLLKTLSEKTTMVELKIIEKPYKGLEPTIWRMMPLWDPDVHYLFSRDLDSLPCSEEIRAIRVFIKSGLLVHGIRSHPAHDIRLLAGLCGFKCPELVRKLGISFERYMSSNRSHKDGRRGCDQELLQIFFSGFIDQSLDSPIFKAGQVGFEAVRLPKEMYDSIDLSNVNPVIQKICDENARYSGAVVGISNEAVKHALDAAGETGSLVKEVLKTNSALEAQYGAL